MSTLNRHEKIKLEKFLNMSGGYVLDFSNRTLSEFVFESLSIDIYDEKYKKNGDSKAKLIRSFWDLESDLLVGKLLAEFIEYWKTCGLISFQKESPEDKIILDECERIIKRLNEGGDSSFLENLKPREDDKTFSFLVRSIRESIERNQPESALDRLHTYVMRYVRRLGESRGVVFEKDKALHSIFGELVKILRENEEIESEMADRILKFSISLMESFNEVRNNRSLAHDNNILNYEESILIVNNVASAIRFLEAIDKKRSVPKLAPPPAIDECLF